MQGSSATASTVGLAGDLEPERVRTLGKYELLRLIARGGMGEVHLARLPGELGFEKRLVIKTIRSDLAADPRFVELFAAEAKIAVALSHPNIAPIYELGRAADGTLYTAMGWVDGPSLETVGQRLRSLGRTLELDAALFITRELLDGLAHAHSRDRDRPPVVHRDITPRNVLADRSGRVQIVDFGIAKPAQTEVVGRMGSAGYMAPEQARGEPVDPRADVFGVGCVLYELLTNERALADEGVWMLPNLARLPAPVASVLERALALEPAERFADAEAFLRAVAPILATEAPTFGTRDLAAILAQLRGDDWETATDEQTPATRITGAVETFATRATPALVGAVAGEGATTDDSAAAEPQHTRTFAWPLAALLAVSAGLVGFFIARAAADRHTPDTDAARAPSPADASKGPVEPVEPAEPEMPSNTDAVAIPDSADEPPAERPSALGLVLEPEDATVYLDGELLRGPPYALARTGELRVEHPDFRAQTISLADHADTGGPLEIELDPLEPGSLTVLAPSVAWAEVWVDGAKLGTTPLTDKPVLEGKHKLEVRCTAAVCGTAQVLLERSIRVRPSRPLKLNTDE